MLLDANLLLARRVYAMIASAVGSQDYTTIFVLQLKKRSQTQNTQPNESKKKKEEWERKREY